MDIRQGYSFHHKNGVSSTVTRNPRILTLHAFAQAQQMVVEIVPDSQASIAEVLGALELLESLIASEVSRFREAMVTSTMLRKA